MIAKFKIGATVSVRSLWTGKVLSMRLHMEDETFKYVVKDLSDSDHVETVSEMELTGV